jgi:histidinol-phosphate phosphatase family protein
MKFQNWDIKSENWEQWSLFFDRDGVINRRLVDDYVKKPDDFEFLEEVPQSLAFFKKHFKYLFLVTNQQGIGKGLMTVSDLKQVHHFMMSTLEKERGQFDALFYCPHLAVEACNCRKPQIGMAKQAQQQFPDIDFSQSILLGDSVSDMQFGRNAGMKTVWIGALSPKVTPQMWDAQFESLAQLVAYLKG